ncbi:MAG: SH3 domain-containing protein [Chloroflexota bacterium]
MPENGRSRHDESSRPYEEKQPIPWLWLGMGLVVTIISIAVAIVILRSFLLRPPLEVGALPEPTVIRLTAPPTNVPSPTAVLPTPTSIPTFTPVPTPDVAVAPLEITIGFYASIFDTGGVGLTIRGGPSTSNPPIVIAEEGSVVLVIDGPEEGNDLLWWQVELADGTQGWGAADFLRPAAAP